MNYKQIKAIEKANKERILKVCPSATEESGIYFFRRHQVYGYIGKSKNLLTRLASHLVKYDPIDRSLRKRGFKGKDNPFGWELNVLKCPIEDLDVSEAKWIDLALKDGIQLYNIESGGTTGKTLIAERKPPKGYRDGLKQGYKNAQKEIRQIFKYLPLPFVSDSKLSIRMYEKLKSFLEGKNGE